LDCIRLIQGGKVSRFQCGLLLTAALAACGASEPARKGLFEARWTGSDTGQLAGSAVAEWCDEQRRLEIRTVRGDTGVAVAVFPEVVLAPDTYRVVLAGSRDSQPPAARVALRYFSPTAISGFQGDSGAVVLERTDSGQLTGRVAARASSVSNSDRVTLTGKFENLAVVPQSRGCTADSGFESAEAADTDGVD
jgi:hypothetical protein